MLYLFNFVVITEKHMKNNMKRVFLLCMFTMLFSIISFSQVHWGGDLASYRMDVSLSAKGDSAVLKVKYTSEGSSEINDNPRLLLKFNNDSIIDLSGIKLQAKTIKGDGVVIPIGSISYVASDDLKVSEASFTLSEGQAKLFSLGLKKFRIKTMKSYYEKEWSRDRVGKTLYEQYNNSKNCDNFRENF